MRATRALFGAAVAVLMITYLTGAGCVVTFEPDPGGGDGDGGQDTGPTTITIRIRNNTNTTLDPEIFLSADPVSSDQLFDASRKVTNFGVGTLGLLGSFASDSITVNCDQARVIGTQGGSFGDDLNNPEGTGRAFVLSQDLNFLCGDTITWTYSRSGGGFTTSLDLDE